MSSQSALYITLIADVVTVMGAVGGLLIALFKKGYNDGRLAEILSNLQTYATDHEARIRVLETHQMGKSS